MTRADEAPSGHRLRIQTVLDGTGRAELTRFVEGMSAACAWAKDNGRIATATLAVADISNAVWASARDVADLAGDVFDETRYVRVGHELGPAGAHNALFASAVSSEDAHVDVALVTNADTYAAPRLVGELLTPLEDPRVGIVEARQLPLELPKAHDPDTGDTSWASATCFVIRQRLIEELGGFDSADLAWSGYDVDLSWRARHQGWRVVHRPGARVFVDRRISAEEETVPPAGEDPEIVRHQARATVLLPWRYSRPDVAMERLSVLAASPDAVERDVAGELRARIDRDGMPDPIDAAHDVGQFVAGGYAVERFSSRAP